MRGCGRRSEKTSSLDLDDDALSGVPSEGERAFEHGGERLSDWLSSVTESEAAAIGVAIEVQRGPVVESLLERGIEVQ